MKVKVIKRDQLIEANQIAIDKNWPRHLKNIILMNLMKIKIGLFFFLLRKIKIELECYLNMIMVSYIN